MTWSLWLSRWKQLVLMSLSSASLQMGRLYLRQKARLHCLQEEEASRAVRREERWWWKELGLGLGERGCCCCWCCWSGVAAVVLLGLGGGAGWLLLSCWGPSGMMVLFWKQVHLQKEGTAVRGRVLVMCWMFRGAGSGGEGSASGDGDEGEALTCAGQGCQDGEKKKERKGYSRHGGSTRAALFATRGDCCSHGRAR